MESSSVLRCIENHAWRILVCVAAVVTCVHLLTVGSYPCCWYDEIEILECGRFSLFDVHPEWSVNLFFGADGEIATPSPLFHCYSGALLESLYRMTDGFVCGRVIMLLSLPVCALLFFVWLRMSGFATAVSLGVALLFLVDPNATICARWFRPDLWCMTMALSALVLIGRSSSSRFRGAMLFASGVLLAMSAFFWITSVLFFPLALLGLWNLKDRRGSALSWMTAGGLFTSLVIMIPLYPHAPEIVNFYLTRSEISSMGAIGSGALRRFGVRLFDFVKIAMRSPFVWATAIVGVCVARERRLHVLAFAGLVCFMLATHVYHLRMVYLMPWLFLFAAAAIDAGARCGRPWGRRGATGWVLLSFAAALSISVILLNYAAWPEKNTFAEFSRQLRPTIEGASPRVYLHDMEHEVYYAGRRLGWRLYSAMPRKMIFEPRHEAFLKSMDAIVVSAAGPKLSDGDRAILRKAGFSESSRIDMPPATTSPIKRKIAAFIYANGYPSCVVWTRK